MNEHTDRYQWNTPGGAGSAYSASSARREVLYPEHINRSYVPAEVKTPKKSGGAGKFIALALVCTLGGGVVGGAVGAGATQIFDDGSAVLHVSSRASVPVKQMHIDGQTAMTNAENYASNVNSVVSINVGTQTNYFGRTVAQASSGSGFVLTDDGYIMTNYHVVSGATTIQVTLYDGQTYAADYIGGDEENDIAVIKIDAQNLTPVTIGNSDRVNVGDNVIAIGNPLGELTFSMTSGSVSSANRAITVEQVPFNMIQVDCPINPGNSGGPLFNEYGEVIGIVSAKYTDYSNTTVEGLGFAIPINDVYTMVEDIIAHGYVTNKAYFNITGVDVTAQNQRQYNLATDSGFYVSSVEENSAAQRSGLQPGDIIIKIDDSDITSRDDLLSARKRYRAGDTVQLTVNRGGEEVTLPFTFDAQPRSDEQSADGNAPSDNRGQGDVYDGYGNYWDSYFGGMFGR